MSTTRLRPPAALRPRLSSTVALLGGSTLLIASAYAHVPSSPDKPAGKAASPAMNSDPAVLTQLSSFLRDYHHALATGNRQFLAAHTVFPLPFAEAEYQMEAKAR